MTSLKAILLCFIGLGGTYVCAQDHAPFFLSEDGPFDEDLREELREARLRASEHPQMQPSRPSLEEIDSLILQTLYYSLLEEPESFQNSTGFSDAEISRLIDMLGGFTNVVLQEQRYALNDMCEIWNPEAEDMESMINETLSAFDFSRVNRNTVVFRAARELLIEIENNITSDKLARFQDVMGASRDKLADSPIFTFAQNARILGDPAATLQYHCEGDMR